MPSLISGYEYDIFISYRQKDNKYDGWVTEFISNLKKELEATFKEDISIYFDENPHDGLLETHDVGGSLKEKLNCLIFIPIISRTYCDAKSFAWNHEFLAYIRSAAADSLGLKVRLPNGNLASRVLPVRIHELETSDKQMIETELQGPLRAIDFTFHSAGVNRPLRPKDDESAKGAGQTSYRDQINKTANAISDIIRGMQGMDLIPTPAKSSDPEIQAPISREQRPRRNWRMRSPEINKVTVLGLGLIVSLLALVTLAIFHFSEAPPEGRTYRTIIPAPDNTNFSTAFGGHLALSPDGRTLVFAAMDSAGKTFLWVRQLHELTAQVLSGTEGANFPFWSPDSRFIGFFADGRLKKIEASGGPPLTLCDVDGGGRGGTWSENGIILFCAGGGLLPISIVSAAGGIASNFTKLDTTRNEQSHRWPFFLPDGRHFLFSSRTGVGNVGEEDAIYLASLDTTYVPRIIAHSSSSVEYANGHILYSREQTLMAQPFDTKSLQTTGDAFPVAERLYFELLTGKTSFSVSRNGVLAYETGARSSGINLRWYDRTGKQVGVISQPSVYNDLRLSPDGTRVAISQHDPKSRNTDIWLYELHRAVWTRFTFDPATERWPNWSPDGSTLIFASDRTRRYNLFQRASSGEGSEELMLGTDLSKSPTDWSRDGRFVAYSTLTRSAGEDIWILPMDPNPKGARDEGKPFAFLQTEFSESRAAFSPDGRWIAYQSNESGSFEVYIRPFPGPGGKWQVSTNGGTRPRWRLDGKELFFLALSADKIMSAEIKLGATTVDVGSDRPLFQMNPFGGGGRDVYDVTGDGQRFLITTTGNVVGSKAVTLVVNWPWEIKK